MGQLNKIMETSWQEFLNSFYRNLNFLNSDCYKKARTHKRLMIYLLYILNKIHRNISYKYPTAPRLTWSLGLLEASMTVKGQCFMSDWTVASLNLRPINRLASKMVLEGLMATCIKIRLRSSGIVI